ncbi:MAG: hypothetical protein PWQ49_884 [Methanohalophilus sp.]|nr:hypothetical protein [Methanohalophilus sp.]
MNSNYVYNKILIYSPNMGGHRQVYCNVITHWALESELDVLLYVGNDWCKGENICEQVSPYIDMYSNSPNVSILDGIQKSPFMSDSEYLLILEKSLNPDLIFVISGDEFNNSLYSVFKDLIRFKKHFSKWVGIFISCWCYPNSANWLKQNILKIILKRKVKHFDVHFWLDEYFANSSSFKKAIWLPDISKSFNLDGNYLDDKSDLLCSQIDNFLMNNKGREVLLFFGRDFNRKGFDFLVELALNDENFVVLRTGESLKSDENRKLMEKMAVLENDGRLLNINQFIKSPTVIERIFNATNFIPLPYRDHYSSSGVMLQAMEFNKPVIVPDIGLMGKRVIDNNIGLTYKHKDFVDFKKAVYEMQATYSKYINNINHFYARFRKENIFSYLDLMINDDTY